MPLQRPILDKSGNQIFDSQEIFSVSERERKSGSIEYASLNVVTLDISNTVSSSKLKYYERLANKLNDPKTGLKIYWKMKRS